MNRPPRSHNTPPEEPQDGEGAPEGQAPTLGTLLRALFQAGASDDVVTRFVPLYQNLTSASPVPPAIDLGPALTEAAHAAGVEVARGLLSQISHAKGADGIPRSGPELVHGTGAAARASSSPAQTPPPKPNPPPPNPKTDPSSVVTGQSVRSVDAMVSGQIYRFNVAGRRTSVSLPLDLLESARQAFGDAGLKEVVRKIYSQVPPKRSNRSAFVRDVLRDELSRVPVSTELVKSALH